jgi:putative tryptophan/tyrosine transport system substrate-binding protein
MRKTVKITFCKNIFIVIFLCLTMVILGNCGSSSKPFSIGIVNSVFIHDRCIKGFKAGMEEFGYSEGKNIKYIYNGEIPPRNDAIDAEIKKLLSQGVDMLFVTGNEVALQAKKTLKGTGIPIVVGSSDMMVEHGLVESLSHPGGNITGVQVINSAVKAMEWLKVLVPGLKKIYVPYNPDDTISIFNLKLLTANSSRLGVELKGLEVHSVKEAVAVIEGLPKDAGAIIRIPSPTIDPGNSELSQAAIKRSLPMAALLILDKDVLITLGSDFYDMGKEAAKLAHQIYQGTRPADLPVKLSEVSLTVNLKTAEKIGLQIPNSILSQANKIIR